MRFGSSKNRESRAPDQLIARSLDIELNTSASRIERYRVAKLDEFRPHTEAETGVRFRGDLGRRLAIACANKSRGQLMSDVDNKGESPSRFRGISLFWAALAVIRRRGALSSSQRSAYRHTSYLNQRSC
jgi:hypothetical protein